MAAYAPAAREVELMIAAATAAPSLHNTQPWRFGVEKSQIHLFADPSRHLRQVDADARQLTISCGTALLNLRLAAAHLGVQPKVRLFPDRARPTLVATVTLSRCRVAPGPSAALYEAIPLRHTNRHPFEDEPLSPEAAAAMSEAAHVEGAELELPDDVSERTRLAGLVRAADLEQDRHPELALEAAEWTGVDASRTDGVPGYALGPVPDLPDATVRDLRRGSPVAGRAHEPFERTPVLAVLFTRADDRESWVRAGQALERVWLTATIHGLSVSFVNQPLELPALRRTVLGPGTMQGYPQMLLRLGRGSPVPPTPRRALADTVAPQHPSRG